MNSPGLITPPLSTIAAYHPQFALAIANGCRARPNMRTVSAKFSAVSVGQTLPAPFDTQMGGPAIFCGAAVSIDPTGAFAGNPLKSMSDTFQAMTSGILFNMTVRSDGEDYSPIPASAETPLQLVPGVLNPTAGMWTFDMPDQLDANFTVAAAQPAAPFTVWVAFSFIVLKRADANPFLCMTAQKARQKLRECFPELVGYCGPPCGTPAPSGAG